uniref:ATP-dependent RNA helicase hrpB n=1 Tax=Magnetococcus massalia (strain MO-1) TaxID=451514 RepID=A0A1S7LF14_MAGMO|nr:ATP-dependent RNA helicase hrpB [Candidatus Magnetococcus massalia]
MLPDYPISSLLPALTTALDNHSVVLLSAPTGSGKSTLAPLSLLQAPWLAGQKMLMLEPRRIAARATAARMAELLGEPVGQQVGWQVRFDRKVGPKTRLEVVTEGILTRRLQADPELSGVGLVIFDEFHERNLNSDLGLALCLDLLELRDDLRLLVMSATLEVTPLKALLEPRVGEVPLLKGEGFLHPITHHYLEQEPELPIHAVMARQVAQQLGQSQGNLLAFLPGAGEIRRCEALLKERLPRDAELEILPLYGDLTQQAQQQVFKEGGRRKVILATDIAETSLTLPGITTVVDGGLCRRPRFDAGSGLTRLETQRISRASADQRAGRAGRLGPGSCLRLWSARTQQGLVASSQPEIATSDLAPLLLELALWGVPDPLQLAWLTPPSEAALEQARTLLQELQALDGRGRITPMGRQMAALPLHPRLAHMILQAQNSGEKALACDLAALLSERDPLKGVARGRDIQSRLELLVAQRRGAQRRGEQPPAEQGAIQQIMRSVKQIRRLAGVDLKQRSQGEAGLLLAAAYPDRVALLRPGSRHRYLLANGRGVQLDEQDPLAGEEMLVVAHLDGGSGSGQRGEGRIYLTAALHRPLFEQSYQEVLQPMEMVSWQAKEERVAAERVVSFGALILSRQRLEQPDEAQVSQAMVEGVRSMGPTSLSWNGAVQQLRARVALLRQHEGDAHPWPDLSDAALWQRLEQREDNWLLPWIDGINRRSQLAKLNLQEIMQSLLSWPLQQRLEMEAPTHMAVPSGSKIRLDYSTEGAPVLAVKIQELFGLAETPRICGGRLPLKLHLLNPARRPVQVTEDLASFWQTAWPEVRKELRGRYPKHPWPEDPWNALPTARTKRRSS